MTIPSKPKNYELFFICYVVVKLKDVQLNNVYVSYMLMSSILTHVFSNVTTPFVFW